MPMPILFFDLWLIFYLMCRTLKNSPLGNLFKTTFTLLASSNIGIAHWFNQKIFTCAYFIMGDFSLCFREPRVILELKGDAIPYKKYSKNLLLNPLKYLDFICICHLS